MARWVRVHLIGCGYCGGVAVQFCGATWWMVVVMWLCICPLLAREVAFFLPPTTIHMQAGLTTVFSRASKVALHGASCIAECFFHADKRSQVMLTCKQGCGHPSCTCGGHVVDSRGQPWTIMRTICAWHPADSGTVKPFFNLFSLTDL